jgi:hypothetical protein
MTGVPGRLLTPDERVSVVEADVIVGIAQENLSELLDDRARLWARLIDDGVQPTAIANATGKTRGAIIAAVNVRQRQADR